MNYEAMYRAVVVDNADPKGLSRVRLKIPQILGDGQTGWAYPLGSGSIPEINAPVWATFEGGDISFPVYLPALAASGHTHPESDVTSLVADIAALTTSKASLSGAAFTGNVSTTGTLTATSTISASGLAGSLLSSATPLVNGTAAAGTSAIPSRQDHVHPTDTSRAASTHSHAESDVTSLVSDLAAKAPINNPVFTGLTGVTISRVDSTQEGGELILNRSSDNTAAWHIDAFGSGTQPALRFFDASSTVRLSIDSSGNVNVINNLNQRGAAVPVVTVAGTAPSSPNTGDIWVDSSSTYSPKRMWAGVASVTFTSGAGTLSFGSTLPVAPTTVVLTPSLGATPVITSLGGTPTTTGVSIKAWTATVAAGSTVATYTGTLSSIHWVAVE